MPIAPPKPGALGLGGSAHLAMRGCVAPGMVSFWCRLSITAVAPSLVANLTNAHP